MEVISAQNIVKQYSTGHGILDVSLSVSAGQCFGLLGANGSGKTTLTHLVAGLDRIQKGLLSVLGYPSFRRPVYLRKRCGVALDTPAHWQTLSGRQNLVFFARQYGLTGSELNQRVEQLLTEADLVDQANDPVSTYSFGMRRKLNIIQALVHTPDLLILDEPSAGLDMVFLGRLAQWIQDRCQHGQTTWIADNDADWLSRTATDVILLSKGHIVAAGAVSELMNSIDARYRVLIELENSVVFTTPTFPGLSRFNQDGNHIQADVNGDLQLPVQLLQWITDSGGQVRSMEVRSITLHEALQQRIEQQETII